MAEKRGTKGEMLGDSVCEGEGDTLKQETNSMCSS